MSDDGATPVKRFLTLWCALAFFSACATQRPVLYPNEHLKSTGADAAEYAVDQCMRSATDYVGTAGGDADTAGSAAAHGTGAAAVGAAAGAAGGAVVGHAGRGAAVGAAGAGAAGLTRGLLRGVFRRREPDPVYRNYVNRCLRDKGYDLIGWK